MKKFIKFTLVLIIALLVSGSVYATPVAKGDATMSLVKDETANIEFGRFGKFEKKMVNIDTGKKTIDIRLTVKNDQVVEDKEVTETVMKPGQVIFLIDGSKSMLDERTIDGKTTTRQKVVIDSAKDLAEKLFKDNENIKIGVVEFATTTVPTEEGGENDAKIITPTLVNNKTDLETALDSLESNVMGPRTNIEVGLEKAEELLNTVAKEDIKDDEGRYIIVLTDAIPNTAKGVSFDTYSEKTSTPTKNKLIDLKSKNIDVISLLMEMSEDEIYSSLEDPKPTYKEVAERVFGTSANPTAGPVYYVSDSEATQTITNNIYKNLTKTVTTTVPGESYVLTDIVIKDLIPQNIVDNFNFEYTVKPNKGTVTDKIDTKDNSITWTIPELKPGESATLTYRLSLKDTFDNSIVAINLPTNKDVTIDYLENGEKGETKHNDKCPIVILDVEAKKDIPQTGSNTWFNIALLATVSLIIGALSFVSYKRMYK